MSSSLTPVSARMLAKKSSRSPATCVASSVTFGVGEGVAVGKGVEVGVTVVMSGVADAVGTGDGVGETSGVGD